MIHNPDTELYGVIGSPVSHSKSPWLFNQIFAREKMNRVYLAFEHSDAGSLMKAMKILKISGYSVTVPHKEAIFPLLDETDEITKILKAVNTVVHKDGILRGYNTDGLGAIEAIETHEKRSNQTVGNWKKSRLAILGSGGAARGMILTMLQMGFAGEVQLIARNQTKALWLIEDIRRLGGKASLTSWDLLEKMGILEADLIINTTSVGMISKSKQPSRSPLEEKHLNASSTVFDVVYTPLQTELLQKATRKGCAVIDGLDMFLSQANHQLALWTGKRMRLGELRSLFLGSDYSR